MACCASWGGSRRVAGSRRDGLPGGHAHAASDAAKRAIAHGFGTAPVLIREGGSIPVVEILKRLLGVDTLLLGWGQNTDNLHGPNEHFSLTDFHRGIRASARLWAELSRQQSLTQRR